MVKLSKSVNTMDPWKKIKASGTFKRNVKKNFNKIVNMSPQLVKEVLESESNVRSSEPSGSQDLSTPGPSTHTPEIAPEAVSNRFEPSSHRRSQVNRRS